MPPQRINIWKTFQKHIWKAIWKTRLSLDSPAPSSYRYIIMGINKYVKMFLNRRQKTMLLLILAREHHQSYQTVV